MALIPGYTQLKSGILVPDGTWELMKAKSEEIERKKRGRFFSNYNRWRHTALYGQEKPIRTPSFAFLREVAKASPIDKVIIAARVVQIRRMAQRALNERQLGFRVVHDRWNDPNFKPTPSELKDIEKRCDEVERILETPTREIHPTVKHFFVEAVKDELILDRKAIVIYRDRRGRPVQFHYIDPATIRPRLQVLLPWMVENGETNIDRAAERMSYANGIDLTKAAWVQVIDEQIVAAWTEDEMSVDITNPVSEVDYWGYGVSALEQSLEFTDAFIQAWRYNTELFKQNYPEAILVLLGDYDPEGLEAFKRQILGEVGPGQNWRLPVVPGGDKESFDGKLLKLRDTPKDMQFAELIRIVINLKAAAYRMHPGIINFSTDAGSGQAIFSHQNAEALINLSQDEGLGDILENMAEWLTRAIIKPRYPDLRMIWTGLNAEDQKAIVDRLNVESQTYLTVDEVRARQGLSKLPNGAGQYINSPYYFQAQAMAAAQQQGQPGQGQAEGAQDETEKRSGGDGNYQPDVGQPGGDKKDDEVAITNTKDEPKAETVNKSRSARQEKYLEIRLVS